MSESDVVVKAHAKNCGWYVRDDVGKLRSVGGASLGIEGIVLDEVLSDVGVKGTYDVFLDIEVVDEGEEEFALISLGSGVPRAV